MRKSFTFYLMCFVTLLLFILYTNFIFTQTGLKLKSNIFPPVYNVMNVILETKTDSNDDIILQTNKGDYDFEYLKMTMNRMLTGKITSINILVKKSFKKEIKNIIIYDNIKARYFKDLSSFKKSETDYCFEGKCSTYYKYEVPQKTNFHSIQNLICNFILTVLSGNMLVLIPCPFLLLFITLIYFLQNKDEIRLFKVSPYVFTGLIFIVGIILYSNGIKDYLPWGDEYYTVQASHPLSDFGKMFRDPGNPPLFYMLFRIFISIFGVTTVSMRVFPLIISILFVFILWFFLKKRYGIKTANLGAILAFINVPLIYFAQEARSYILQALFTPLIVWSLFNIIEKNRTKDYLTYGLLAAVVANIHYFEIILLISNFIFISILFSIEKRFKDILKFLGANLIGAVAFLPYFLLTANEFALVDSTFNNWIPHADFDYIKRCIYYLFGGKYSLILSCLFFIVAFFKKNKMAIYSFSIMALTISLAIMFSNLIRPMLVERYVVLLCPLFVIFLTVTFHSGYKNKFLPVLFLLWVLLFQSGSIETNNRQKGLIDFAINIANQYVEHKNKNENVYVTVGLADFKLFNDKDKIVDERVTHVKGMVQDIRVIINNILEKDKNAVIFTQFLIKNKNTKQVFFLNPATKTGLWRIENL